MMIIEFLKELIVRIPQIQSYLNVQILNYMKIHHLVFLPVEKKGYRNSKHLVLKTLVIFAKKILKILFVIHNQ